MASAASHSPGSTGRGGLSAPIVALIPPGPGCPLEEFNPVIQAQEEAMYYAENARTQDVVSEVTVFQDAELKAEVVEMLGPETQMVIPVRCELPFLVAHIKDVEKFCKVIVKVVDQDKRIRTLEMSSRLTITRVSPTGVTMPLVLEPGVWNHVCVDLSDMLTRAFGSSYQYCREVTVTASCVLGRLFFQDHPYEDVELPAFLRVVDSDDDEDAG